MDKRSPQIFLDCDGVLADFDNKALELFGMESRAFEKKYGTNEFWKRIMAVPDFFNLLEEMEDARHLHDAVKHLDPIILTGAPVWWPDAIDQKTRWAKRIYGEQQKIIVCQSKKKYLFASPGDILIDDWPKYTKLWESVGGIFILHTSSHNSITILEKMGVL